MTKPPNEDHPFFCKSKGVRKSAWETPEYLSEQDWEIAKEASKAKTSTQLCDVVFKTQDAS